MAPDSAPYDERGQTGSNVPDWGTLGSSAELGDEEVAELKYPAGLKVFHRMRADAQIDALMKAVILPIRRRKWFIDPNGARDEIVEGVSNDFALPVLGEEPKPLPRRRRFNHDDHLRHALLALAYGHMFMEQLGIIDDGLKWRLKKLAPRMPLTITKIEVADDGGLKAIWQKASSQQIVGGRRPARPRVSSENNVVAISSGMFGHVDIPVERLVAYVWEREGGNWAGRPMLRPLYPHWLLKDILMRVDAIKHERFGAGIPTGKAPSGGDVSEYARMAQQIRAGESAGAGLPSGAELFVEGVRGTIPDIIASIRYHDEQMAKDFLAMFLQLGQCVDEETEILTRRGWLRHNEVQEGDECLGIAATDGLARWQPIKEMHRFPAMKREMVRMRGRSHDSLTTPNHRWLVERDNERYFTTTDSFEHGEYIPCGRPVVNLPVEPKYEDALVQLVGWFAAEGSTDGSALSICQSESVNAQHCTTIRAALTALYGPAREVQALTEEEKVAVVGELRNRLAKRRYHLGNDEAFERGRLAAQLVDSGIKQSQLVKDLGTTSINNYVGYYRDTYDLAPEDRPTYGIWTHAPRLTPRTTAYRCTTGDEPQWREQRRIREHGYAPGLRTGITWHLNRAASEPILAATLVDKIISYEFIHSLTRAQLQILLDALIDGDGYRSSSGSGVGICQKDPEWLNRVQMIASLLGYRSYMTQRSSDGIWTLGVHTRTRFSPRKRNQEKFVQRVEHDGMIWCPVTPDQTWLARRNGTVYFTGNTATGSRALGNTFVDFFEMSLETVSGWYEDITSEHVIEDWVDWNYGVDEPAPRLVSSADDSGMLPTTELVGLIDAGVLAVDDNLRNWITRRYSMPKQPTLEEEAEIKRKKAEASGEFMQGVPTGNNGQPPPDPDVYPPPPPASAS